MEEPNKNFLKHVFNFDDESKYDMLNIMQYSILSIVPIVILNKSIQRFIPEVDEDKQSIEILAEIIIQIIVMLIGLLFTHRIVTYIPTYSEQEYPNYNIIMNILAIVMIVLSLQTKIGEKTNILVERIDELWNGKSSSSSSSSKPTVKVSQPLSNQRVQYSAPPPPPPQVTNEINTNQNTQYNDTNMMQQPQQTNNVYTHTQSNMSENEPVAANEISGFSGF
jgi:hypothetical protein